MKEQKRSKDFDRMIIEAVQGHYSFFAWQSIGGVVEKCELKIKAYRKDYNEIELEACPGEEDRLGLVISGNRVLNIYVPESSISFHSEVKTISEGKKVKMYLPLEYSFFERRKHERVQPQKSCYASFEYNKQIIKKTIYDFSLGGIAIILPQSEKIKLSKERPFYELSLDIGLRKMKVKAVCVNTITIDRYKFENLPYGGFKLCYRFIEMNNEDRAFLSEFITHEKLMQQVQKKAN
ncbi:MAG: PilZ domain-containing protein [Bacteriovorax sp.]|jgi:c-di-GMP-binding flagellar brake protein YcgR|nr:PilZ domain-containing protein [Bacteriovorax sp.]